ETSKPPAGPVACLRLCRRRPCRRHPAFRPRDNGRSFARSCVGHISRQGVCSLEQTFSPFFVFFQGRSRSILKVTLTQDAWRSSGYYVEPVWGRKANAICDLEGEPLMTSRFARVLFISIFSAVLISGSVFPAPVHQQITINYAAITGPTWP